MSEPMLLSIDLSPLSYLKEARQFIAEKNVKQGIQSMDAAIIFSGNSPFYIYQKIKCLFSLGAFQLCNDLIVTQLEFLYKNASLYIICRTIDYYQKINDFSIKDLKTHLETHHLPFCLADEYSSLLLNPNNSLWNATKKALFKDQHSLCISYCDIMLKGRIVPNEVLYMKAYCHYRLGELYLATRAYETYLAACPKDAGAYNELGLIYMEQGLFDRALTHLNKAIQLAPNHKDYLLHLGECYMNCKQYTLTLQTYARVESLFPSDSQVYFNLCYTYKKHHKLSLYKKYVKKLKKQLR